MKKVKLVRYVWLSLLGVTILYVIPFLLAQKYLLTPGYNHFREIFNNMGFVISIKNTLIFMVVFVPIAVVSGFVLAFFTEYLELGFWTRAAIILPITIPAVSVAGFFREIGDKLLLKHIGGLSVVGLVFLWSCIGYTYIIFLISFKNRDKTIEEAAYLDGAGMLRALIFVIIPLHVEAVVLSVIISMYNSLKIFRMTYAIFGEYPDYRMFMIQNFLHIKLKELDLKTLMAAADILLLLVFLMLLAILATEKHHKKNLLR